VAKKNQYQRPTPILILYLFQTLPQNNSLKTETETENLLIITETFQHIRVASPVFIHFHVQFNMNLFPKEFL
jgi:hypothetical protein